MIRCSIWRDGKKFIAIPGESAKTISEVVAIGNPIRTSYHGLTIPGCSNKEIYDERARKYPFWCTVEDTEIKPYNLYNASSMILIRNKAVLLLNQADFEAAAIVNREEFFRISN